MWFLCWQLGARVSAISREARHVAGEGSHARGRWWGGGDVRPCQSKKICAVPRRETVWETSGIQLGLRTKTWTSSECGPRWVALWKGHRCPRRTHADAPITRIRMCSLLEWLLCTDKATQASRLPSKGPVKSTGQGLHFFFLPSPPSEPAWKLSRGDWGLRNSWWRFLERGVEANCSACLCTWVRSLQFALVSALDHLTSKKHLFWALCQRKRLQHLTEWGLSELQVWREDLWNIQCGDILAARCLH